MSKSQAPTTPTEHDPILISCEYMHEETPSAVDISQRLAGEGEAVANPGAEQGRVFVLRDRCRIRQGPWELAARQMVIWRTQTQRNGRPVDKLLVYAEGDVQINPSQDSTSKSYLLIEMHTSVGVTEEVRHAEPGHIATGGIDPLHRKAIEARGKIEQTAFNQPQLLPPGEMMPLANPDFDFDQLVLPSPVVNQRRVVVSPRSFGIGFNVSSFLSEQTSPPEQITVITQGVNIVIEGLPGPNGMNGGAIDLSADQVVIWTQANSTGRFSPEMYQDRHAPLQIFLEGNIEIRQGNHVLKAARAFYDIREDRAVLHQGELRVQISEQEGEVRLRAERIRQLSSDSFHAQNAWVSGSEFGVPTYRLEAGDIFLENRYERGWLGRGDAKIDPETGLEIATPTPWITSLDNRFRIGETPVFASPYLSSPADVPSVPITSLTVGVDGILGGQIKTVWNMSQLLGLSRSPGLNWDLQLHGYTNRGVWLGTNADYVGSELFGNPGSYFGEMESVWINDYGNDNLGLDRRNLAPSTNTRGRAMWRHRQQLDPAWSLTGEVGLLSDRNFLEQYYEQEWDSGKDNETLLNLNYQDDNWAGSLMTRLQLNDFEYETQWLPRADFTVLGEPLGWDRLVYSSRTSAGYGQIRPGVAPEDPSDLFVPLWYMPAAEGMVFSSRHELSLPFSVGPVKFDPYLLGEAAYWQDDGFTNSSIHRFYGSAGLRGNLLLSKAFPQVRSSLLGLNGLAHKQLIGFDYSFSDSSQDLNNIPQYNEFDENSQERFRTRLIFNTFGLMNNTLLPAQYDPRFYAVRSGAARNVTSPYFELVDDQHVLRLNWNHRLQTKVGPPDRQRIKDWMTLDLGISYFPNADNDNFGESFGLLTANYMWDVGSRTKFLANGQFDFFDEAPQLWDFGFLSQRSTRGSVYLGYRNLQAGPLESQLLTGSVSYAMSDKWIASLGTAYDIAENQDRGQSLTITGVRSDFLIHMGMSIDASKGNFGVGFMIEPRLGPLHSASDKMSSLLRTN